MKNALPDISIVTPSYNMLPYLPLCCASVRDQEVNHEHIVMDGGSTDGTVEWLEENRDALVFLSERDSGMYNALNKAIARAQGAIIGHLNCDEQYLPGILKYVKEFFESHPDVDFVAADFLVINPAGEFLAYRKSFQPRWQYFFSNYLYTTTCTLFYRRKILENCHFDESYRSIADVIFLYNVLRKGFRGFHVRKYASTFTYSGVNLSLDPISAKEKARFNKSLPIWYQALRPLFFVMFFVEKMLNGNYSETAPLRYSIYSQQSPNKRLPIEVPNPGFRLKFKPVAAS